jgi:nucleotide-binding universal stress UspA family protein
MGKILCAIRGGEEGHRTQDAAAALALERGDDLVFLVVLETSFLSRPPAAGGLDMRGTLTRMGNSILFHAAERARQLGVEACGVLREGTPREQIQVVVQEEGAAIVVLGRPQGCYDKFSLSGLESFAAAIAAATGAEVKIL